MNQENEELAWECAGRLEPKDFMHPICREAYAAILANLRSGAGLDVVSIRHRIDSTNARPDLFSDLVDIGASVEIGRPVVLIERIQSLSKGRALQRLADSIREGAENAEDPLAIIQRSMQDMAALASGSGNNESVPMEALQDDAAAGIPLFPDSHKPSVGRFGIETLDAEVEIPRGEPTVIAARPGCGKTSLGVQLAVESARLGEEVLFISLELPMPRIKAKFASYLTGVPMNNWLTGRTNEGDRARLSELVGNIGGRFRILSPDQGSPWGSLEASIRKHQSLYGTSVFILDYFGYIGIPNAKSFGDSMAYAYAETMKGITRCAKNTNMAAVVLAQITKEGGKSARPTLADLADTDRPARDANLALALYKIGDNTWCRVLKNRYGKAGYDRQMDFDGVRGQFTSNWNTTEAVS